MKAIVIVALITATLFPSGRSSAANLRLAGGADVRTGTFAGARLRLPLGGGKPAGAPRLALTVAPMLRAQSADGRVAMRLTEGLSFGLTGRARHQLSFGGRPVATFGSGGSIPNKKDASGISTLGGVALVGAGVLLGLGIVYVVLASSDDGCCE